MPRVKTSDIQRLRELDALRKAALRRRVWFIGSSWAQRDGRYWYLRSNASQFLFAVTVLLGLAIFGIEVGLFAVGGAALGISTGAMFAIAAVLGARRARRRFRRMRQGEVVQKNRQSEHGNIGRSAVALRVVRRGIGLIIFAIVLGLPYLLGTCVMALRYSVGRYAIGEPAARLAAGLEL